MKRLLSLIFDRNKVKADSTEPSKQKRSPNPKRRRTVLFQDGLAILCVAALLVFNAAARGVNLLMVLGAFFFGFLVVDYFGGKWALRNLRVSRKLPDSIYADEPFYTEIELDATERRKSSWAIVVEDVWEQEESRFCVSSELKKNEVDKKTVNETVASESTSKKKSKKRERSKEKNVVVSDVENGAVTLRPVVYFPQIRRKEKRKEYYVGVFPRRGVRRLRSTTISTRFPCGFFRSSERFDLKDETLVFPKIGRVTKEWESFEGRLAQESSVATSLTSRVPDETVSIRDWRSGDSKRTIAWRATAKRDRLQVREFTKRQTRSVVLILDLFCDERFEALGAIQCWRTTEATVSFAMTLVRRWTESGDSRLFFTLNAEVPPEFAKSDKKMCQWGANRTARDLDVVIGGGSIGRVASRLALAYRTNKDSINDAFRAVQEQNRHDVQIFVVSLTSNVARRLNNDLKELDFVEISANELPKFFEFESRE